MLKTSVLVDYWSLVASDHQKCFEAGYWLDRDGLHDEGYSFPSLVGECHTHSKAFAVSQASFRCIGSVGLAVFV